MMAGVDPLVWILVGGVLMSAIAMTGALTLALEPATLERLLLPLVALAAGTLLGGALFHMIPEAVASMPIVNSMAWLLFGFTVFLALEQFLHWHHSHHAPKDVRKPFAYLVLIGDAVHNFLGGLGIASAFLLSPSAGVVAWIAAAAHEVPQELGDFAVLIHGGWPRRRALFWNVMSALTFLVGAVLAYIASFHLNVAALVAFGAGNFVYIAASDLIPEIKAQSRSRHALLHLASFVAGLVLLYALAYVVAS